MAKTKTSRWMLVATCRYLTENGKVEGMPCRFVPPLACISRLVYTLGRGRVLSIRLSLHSCSVDLDFDLNIAGRAVVDYVSYDAASASVYSSEEDGHNRRFGAVWGSRSLNTSDDCTTTLSDPFRVLSPI